MRPSGERTNACVTCCKSASGVVSECLTGPRSPVETTGSRTTERIDSSIDMPTALVLDDDPDFRPLVRGALEAGRVEEAGDLGVNLVFSKPVPPDELETELQLARRRLDLEPTAEALAVEATLPPAPPPPGGASPALRRCAGAPAHRASGPSRRREDGCRRPRPSRRRARARAPDPGNRGVVPVRRRLEGRGLGRARAAEGPGGGSSRSTHPGTS